jgi:FkbM family methyltransferase
MRITWGRHSQGAPARVSLPWGIELAINPHETIGRSLLNLGVCELTVSETLWRLTDVGDSCLDIGANIGYMTSLLAARGGKSGKVFGFEPHPLVFARLEANHQSMVEGGNSQNYSPVILIQCAIGAGDGEMDLFEPEGFKENEGIASLANVARRPIASEIRYRVELRRLDTIFHGDESFGVVKIDVEGAELAVLHGAERLLTGRRIRDIVFEDFQPFPSESSTLLQRYGYRIYRLVKTISGPVIWNPSDQSVKDVSLPWEPVNYLATLDPDRALIRFRQRGWLCLRAKP